MPNTIRSGQTALRQQLRKPSVYRLSASKDGGGESSFFRGNKSPLTIDVIAIHYNIGIADFFAAIRQECQGYSVIRI